MSDPAAPWWAEVQHLRPKEEGATSAMPATRSAADASRDPDTPVATLERRLPPEMPEDPWATPRSPEESAARWAEVKDAAWMKAATRRAAAEDALFLARLTGEEPPVEALTALEEASARRAGRAAEPRHVERAAGNGDVAPPRDALAGTGERRAPRALWDDALEDAFTHTPAWASENDERLLPKGANRVESGRRTIEIRGQVDRIHGFNAASPASGAHGAPRRRPRTAARLAGRPDRVAMWAFLLGLLLILIAALSDPGDAGATILAPLALR